MEQIELPKRIVEFHPEGHKELIFGKDKIIFSLSYRGKTFEKEFTIQEYLLFKIKKSMVELEKSIDELRKVLAISYSNASKYSQFSTIRQDSERR